MALTKRRLKGLIEYSDLRNVDGVFTEDDVMGVSTDKCMFPTKADLGGVNLLNYKLFPPGSFAFVADTSRRGDKIALAYNNTDKTYIVSTWYVVFKVCDNARNIISPDYLFLYFNRAEFNRYARTNSWGSAREYFWFSDMEEIIIELPPLPVQQKYVAIYKALTRKNLLNKNIPNTPEYRIQILSDEEYKSLLVEDAEDTVDDNQSDATENLLTLLKEYGG